MLRVGLRLRSAMILPPSVSTMYLPKTTLFPLSVSTYSYQPFLLSAPFKPTLSPVVRFMGNMDPQGPQDFLRKLQAGGPFNWPEVLLMGKVVGTTLGWSFPALLPFLVVGQGSNPIAVLLTGFYSRSFLGFGLELFLLWSLRESGVHQEALYVVFLGNIVAAAACLTMGQAYAGLVYGLGSYYACMCYRNPTLVIRVMLIDVQIQYLVGAMAVLSVLWGKWPVLAAIGYGYTYDTLFKKFLR